MKVQLLQTSRNTQVIRTLTFIIIIIVISLSGCKKENSNGSAQSQQEDFANNASQSDAEAEVVFDDVFDNVMGVSPEVAVGGTGVFGRVNQTSGTGENRLTGADTLSCYIVTITQLSSANRFPLNVVIDFGTGCTGKDGRTRKGKIIIQYTGRLLVPGNSSTTTFDGYYVNDIKVEGTHKITNTSTATVKSFTIAVSGARLSQPDGSYLEWNSEKTISQVDGLLTPIPLDDVFNLTGHASGLVVKDNKLFQWNTAISSPLVKRFACHWIVKGTVNIQKGNAPVAVLDYGNGNCDNLATFTVNGVVHEITLR